MNRFFLVLVLIIVCVSIFSQDSEIPLSEVLYAEGVKSYILQDYDEALSNLERAYLLEPENTKIRNIYVNTLIKSGNTQYEEGDAESALSKFILADTLTQNPEVKENLKELINLLSPEDGAKPVTSLRVDEPGDNQNRVSDSSLDNNTGVDSRQSIPADISEDKSSENPGLYSNDQSSPVVQFPDINIEIPIDFEDYLVTQTKENNRILENLITQQNLENERFVNAISDLIETQKEERSFFQRYLIIIIIGAALFLLLFFFIIILLIRGRRSNYPVDQSMRLVNPEEPHVLTSGLNERKFLTSDGYEDVVKIKKLSKLHTQLQRGDIDWDSIQMYLGELNMEIKMELLNLVESKLKDDIDDKSIKNILLPFFNDTKKEIREESGRIFSEMSSDQSSFYALEDSTSKNEDILSVSSLMNFVIMIDAKTGRKGHSKKVSRLVYEITKRSVNVDLDPEEAAKAALVYDIGFLEISDELLHRKSALTKSEFAIIKSHTERGLSFFNHIDLPEHFVHAIKYHHERLDGSGYPGGLAGENIPFIARAIAIADMFNAVISPRPYKNALTPELALEMMDEIDGTLIDSNIYSALKDFLGES